MTDLRLRECYAKGRRWFWRFNLLAAAAVGARLQVIDEGAYGERFTAVDVYFGGLLIFGTEYGSIPDRPGFAAYKERLLARPAYLRAKSTDDALAAAST